MKLICGGKTVQSLPKFDFKCRNSLSTFLKDYSNIAESIKLTTEIKFYIWISMHYVFPTRASVFLTSLTKFGGNKMRSSRRERSFSSNYFIPKCNYIEDSVFQIEQQSNTGSCSFSFLLFLSSFFFLIFSSFSPWQLPVFDSQKLDRCVQWSKRICHINTSRLKKNGHI